MYPVFVYIMFGLFIWGANSAYMEKNDIESPMSDTMTFIVIVFGWVFVGAIALGMKFGEAFAENE